jgi:gamma-glutamyltranspeptidase/glutathione hydrolase
VGKILSTDRSEEVMRILLICFILLSSVPVWSATFEPQWGRQGMVSTTVGPAAAAGQSILEAGGNAVDAGIATAFAAAVAHPFSSGLGGGLFAVLHDVKTNTSRSLDARETAPASASIAWYEENPQSIRSGPRSVGVPGMVQGLWTLHQEYGSLPWAQLIEPAIGLAENGVKVSIWHHNIVERVAEQLAQFPETQRVQTVDGKAPPLGWNHVQPDLAETLRYVQKKGGQALAVGPIAKKIEVATGGVITELDLARFQAKWREPIRAPYRGYEFVGMPLPSSGGVLLAQMFKILERYDLAAMGKDSSEFIHLVASVMKVAFEDRAQYLGDTDFYDVPVERLISDEYADQQAARLNPQGQPSPGVEINQVPDDAGTTHISVMDSHGNAVAITQTVNTLFGSKITVPGTGIVLNNEMDDFSIGPELPNAWEAVGTAANAVAPGKRPLSSMTPTVVLKDGVPVMVVGSSMGTTIISSILHTLINVIDFGFDAQRAVNAPRFHHQWKPDSLTIEPEFPQDVRKNLENLGWSIRERPFFGASELIIYDRENCLFWGGADGRRDSRALGANIGAIPRPSEQVSCVADIPNSTSVVPE